MVQLHSVETELLQLLASQEHSTEDPTLTRSILTLIKNHEETQERYMGGGEGEGEGREGGQRKLEQENTQELLAVYLGHPHILSTSVLQMIMTKPCSHLLNKSLGMRLSLREVSETRRNYKSSYYGVM